MYDATKLDASLMFALAATNEGKLDEHLEQFSPVQCKFIEEVANLLAERAFIVRLRKERAA